MPRNYTQIMCAIWDDPEFLALSEGAQRAYFLLVSQKDISAAGVLHIWTPRWAGLSRTSTDETLKAALSELKQTRFIVPDWQTGELLVRSFVRWDGGYKNGKRKPLIEREALGVVSAPIKAQLKVEFENLNEAMGAKLDTSGLPDPTPPSGSDPSSDRASDGASDSGPDSGPSSSSMGGDRAPGFTANGTAHTTGAPSGAHHPSINGSGENSASLQVDRASDVPSDATHDRTSPFRGVVGTPVGTTGEPKPQIPQSVPPPAASAAAHDVDPTGFTLALVEAEPAVTAHDVVARWAEGFAATGNKPVDRLRKQVGQEARDLLAAGNDPDRVLAAAHTLGVKGRATLVTELAIQSDTGRHLQAVSGDSRFGQRHQNYRNPPESAYDEPMYPEEGR